ncbi:hypothetical protein [Streptomyces flavofungini]|uniref:hypothetical protein n=1 Tax=Streptomyces flavofungini TaxID=68200 RepID=UPI0034DF63AD
MEMLAFLGLPRGQRMAEPSPPSRRPDPTPPAVAEPRNQGSADTDTGESERPSRRKQLITAGLGVVLAAVTAVATGGLQSILSWVGDQFSDDPSMLAVVSSTVDPANNCEGGGGYVFPGPASSLRGFQKYLGGAGGRGPYLAAHRGVPADYLLVQLTVQSRSDTAIVIDRLKINVKGKIKPPQRSSFIAPFGQCGEAEVRNLAFNLDRSATSYRAVQVKGLDDKRQLGKLPATITRDEPEVITVIPYTLKAGYRFTVELSWIEDGERRSMEIDDKGHPFSMVSRVNSDTYDWLGRGYTDYRHMKLPDWSPEGPQPWFLEQDR